MPLFTEPNCWVKCAKFVICMILLISFVAIIGNILLNLYASIALIVVGAILLRYIVDQYGDAWLTDDKYYMSDTEIEEFGRKEIPT